MITLYGMAISNYFNKVKLALLHKGIDFKEVIVFPNQEADFLERTPMGKVPFIEVNGQFISESNAIIEYLEQINSGISLFPADPIQAAKCRQIICYIDMYLDSQARRVFPAAFFGQTLDEKTLDEVEISLQKTSKALQKMLGFKPFINSELITIADYSAITTLPLCSACMTLLKRKDPLEMVDGLEEYYQMMYAIPEIDAIETARKEAVDEMLKKHH